MGFESLALLPRPCLELQSGQKPAAESQDPSQLCVPPALQKTHGVRSGCTDQAVAFSPDYKLTIFSDSITRQIKNIIFIE